MTDDQIRSEQAQQLMQNPAFRDALLRMQDSIDRQRAATGWNETKKREHLYLKERMLVEFQQELASVIETGKVHEPTTSIRERAKALWASKFK